VFIRRPQLHRRLGKRLGDGGHAWAERC
jgi:hypothetical protein